MSQRFTKEIRQQIVREFAVRHNGLYDPGLFLREVREAGPTHPAYSWFEWDSDAAFDRYQLEQARDFARDLRISFRVEEVTSPHCVRVRETPMPLVLSPLATRSKGGGYRLVDPDDGDHIQEHCRQAARTLGEWMRRYEAALRHAGVKLTDIEKTIGRLESAALKKAG
jgi:hypothetical protein